VELISIQKEVIVSKKTWVLIGVYGLDKNFEGEMI